MGMPFEIRVRDLCVGEWVGLYLEEPLDDPNFQDGQVREKTDSKVIIRFGPYIGFREFGINDKIMITWTDSKVVKKKQADADKFSVVKSLVKDSKITIFDKEYTVTKEGKWTLGMTGPRGGRFLLSILPNASVMEDKSITVYEVMALNSPRSVALFTIIDGKIIKLHRF